MADNVELVRQLWSAFERGGIEAVLEVSDPDVEWEPYGGGGMVYRGHEGLRAYMEERRANGEEADARLYSAFAKGEYVVARGEVQIRGEHGIVTMQPGWLYEFRNGKLIRFRGFPTQEAAMREAGLAPRDAIAIVRELVDTFNRRQTGRMLALVDETSEWRPYNGAKDLYTGPEGALEYVEEKFSGASSVTVVEYAFREAGDTIAISGSLNVVEASGAIVQRQVHWLFTVREGRIASARSFARRTEAMAALEATGIGDAQAG